MGQVYHHLYSFKVDWSRTLKKKKAVLLLLINLFNLIRYICSKFPIYLKKLKKKKTSNKKDKAIFLILFIVIVVTILIIIIFIWVILKQISKLVSIFLPEAGQQLFLPQNLLCAMLKSSSTYHKLKTLKNNRIPLIVIWVPFPFWILFIIHRFYFYLFFCWGWGETSTNNLNNFNLFEIIENNILISCLSIY